MNVIMFYVVADMNSEMAYLLGGSGKCKEMVERVAYTNDKLRSTHNNKSSSYVTNYKTAALDISLKKWTK